LTDLCGEMSR